MDTPFSTSAVRRYGNRRHHSDTSFSDLLGSCQHGLRVSTRKGNLSMLAKISEYAGGDVPVGMIDTDFCVGFADFLLRSVKANSARTYLQKLHALLHHAVRRGLLPCNPMPPISDMLPKYRAPEREFLDRDEIRRLEISPCPHEATKAAFLFACHTGLRISDIETLSWGDIRKQNGRYIISKIQVKTGVEVRVPVDAAAEGILNRLQDGRTPSACDRVFHLMSRTMVSQDLNAWTAAAGIGKHVTFHVARHTFATLMISQKTDIYTVSQLCGHTNIQTTMVYVRLVDSARFAAMDGLDALFGYSRHRKPVRLLLPAYR